MPKPPVEIRCRKLTKPRDAVLALWTRSGVLAAPFGALELFDCSQDGDGRGRSTNVRRQLPLLETRLHLHGSVRRRHELFRDLVGLLR